MKLTNNDLNSYVKVLETQFKNKYLRKITFYSHRYLFLQFASEKDYLLGINLYNELPSIFRTLKFDLPSSLKSPFNSYLRKQLTNAKLLDIKQMNHDLIICFSFLITNAYFQKEEIKLYLELINSQPNLIITTNEDIIINALNIKNWQSQRNITPQSKYELPPIKFIEDVINSQFNYLDYEKIEQERFQQNKELRRKEKYALELHFLSTKIKRVKRKISHLENDYFKAQENLLFEDYANELLTHYYHLKTPISFLEINNKQIALNPTKTPVENAQLFFKKARKAKKALSLNNELKIEALKQLNYYLEIKDFISFASEERIDSFLMKNNFLGTAQKFPTLTYHKEDPYRIVTSQTTFYFGKNATQNDFLTFSLAKKDHTWLHVKGLPSAHLVIAKNNISKEDLRLASELLLLVSNLEKGEVIYSLKQNLKRTEIKGEVIVKKYQTIHIPFIHHETKLLLKTARRFGAK